MSTGNTGPSNQCVCCSNAASSGAPGRSRTAAGRAICRNRWPSRLTTPFTMSPPYRPSPCPTGTTCIQPTCCSGFSRGLGIYTRMQANGNIIQRTHNQNGRWNFSATNTKMFPITSYCKVDPTAVLRPCSDPCKCTCITLSNGKVGCLGGTVRRYSNVPPSDPYRVASVRQARNIFVNTAYQMSKNERIAYLSKNRAYLWR